VLVKFLEIPNDVYYMFNNIKQNIEIIVSSNTFNDYEYYFVNVNIKNIKILNILLVGRNMKTLHRYTYILLEFNIMFKTSNENYFNYDGVNPYIRVIKLIKHFNKFKKYLN